MLKSIINTFFTRLGSSVFNLVIAIFISNKFGAEARGTQSLILTTITFLVLFTAIIGSGSIVYLIPRRNTRHLIVPSYLWSFLVCVVIFVFLQFVQMVPQPYVLSVCLLGFILSVTHIHASMLMGIEKVIQSNTIVLINSLVVLLILLVLTLAFKIEVLSAYIVALYGGYLMSFLVSLFFILKNKKRFSGRLSDFGTPVQAFRDLFRYGVLNQLDVIASMLSFRFSYYLIDFYMDKGSLGIYSNAISIVESIWLISRSIAMVQNARIANSKDIGYSADITVTMLKVSFFMVLLVVIALLCIPESFYQFVFGDGFSYMRTIMLFISPGILFFSISFIMSGLFAGTGKYLYNTISSFIGLAITIASSLIFIPRLGLIGAAISATLAYITMTLAKMIFLLRNYPVTYRNLIPTYRDLILAKEYWQNK